MAKVLKVSPHCGSQIEGLQEAEEFAYGILIGQLAVEDKEFLIAHLARTPAEEQGDVDESGESPAPNVEKYGNLILGPYDNE